MTTQLTSRTNIVPPVSERLILVRQPELRPKARSTSGYFSPGFPRRATTRPPCLRHPPHRCSPLPFSGSSRATYVSSATSGSSMGASLYASCALAATPSPHGCRRRRLGFVAVVQAGGPLHKLPDPRATCHPVPQAAAFLLLVPRRLAGDAFHGAVTGSMCTVGLKHATDGIC